MLKCAFNQIWLSQVLAKWKIVLGKSLNFDLIKLCKPWKGRWSRRRTVIGGSACEKETLRVKREGTEKLKYKEWEIGKTMGPLYAYHLPQRFPVIVPVIQGGPSGLFLIRRTKWLGIFEVGLVCWLELLMVSVECCKTVFGSQSTSASSKYTAQFWNIFQVVSSCSPFNLRGIQTTENSVAKTDISALRWSSFMLYFVIWQPFKSSK